MLVLFPGGQIKRIGLKTRLHAIGADALVGLLNIFSRHMVEGLELCIAAVSDAHKLSHHAVDDFPVRRFDKPKLVDARIAGQRRNQSDVRTFRRLDRTDAAIVSRMHVAHFEPRALAAQAARSQR